MPRHAMIQGTTSAPMDNPRAVHRANQTIGNDPALYPENQRGHHDTRAIPPVTDDTPRSLDTPEDDQ